MEQTNKVFVDGLLFSLPPETAPAWVKGRIYIKVEELKNWLDLHNTNGGGINIDVKESAKGNVYCELSTWKPQRPNLEPKEVLPTIEYPQEDLPF